MSEQNTYTAISLIVLARTLAEDMTLIDRVFENTDTTDFMKRFCIAPEKLINNAHAIDVALELEGGYGGEWEVWTTFRKWKFLNDSFPGAHNDRRESYFAIINEHNGL
jgi:hypothetical protein